MGAPSDIHRGYNIVYGLLQAPYAAFAQTMIAELSPPGYYNMVSAREMS
jgi:hypothetical protein